MFNSLFKPYTVQSLARSKSACTFFLLLFLFVNPTIIFAQNPQLKFKHINSQQGLSNSTIEAIYQDSRGFIWFGTRDGLNRYDGYEITVFKNNPLDSNTISDNYIRCIYEDASHNLWIGTSNGLNRFNPGKNTFAQYKHHSKNTSELSNNSINSIYKDSKGTLWIGSADGCLNQLDAKTNSFRHFYYTEAAINNGENKQINYLFEDNKANLWVGTEKGLKLFDRKTHSFKSANTVFNQLTDELNYPVNVIQEDKAGNIWLGIENNGLMVINANSKVIVHYTHKQQDVGSLSNDQVKCLLTDRKGNIWAGSINGGLNLFNPSTNTFKHYQNEPENVSSLSQRTVSALFMDNQSNLWVGTHRGGINLYAPLASKFRLFQTESDKNSLSYNDVRAFYEDKQQNVWIGTDGGGLNLYNPLKNSFLHYRYDPLNNNSLGSDAILDILKDDQNSIWISTWGGGLNCLDQATGNFKRYTNKPGDPSSISSNYVQKSFKDSEGNFWVATYYGGVNLFNPQTGKFSRFINAPDNKTRLQGNNIVTINEDKHKNLWMGTDDGGLNCYNLITKKITHYFNNQEKLPDLRVVFIDHTGRVWLGQAGLYLFKPDQNKFVVFTNKAGLGTEYIKGIEEDSKGNLWISGSNGLTKLNPATQQTVKYNTADGLQGQEFEANASLKTHNGVMYFGGINGFNQFNPLTIEANKFVPPVYITGFQIFNKIVQPDSAGSPLTDDISLTKNIDLSYKQSTIALYFSALNYTSPENNKYAYKLEGLDDNWYYTGTERKAAYTNLSPGTYTFRVRAANNDGVWNEMGNSLTIIIKPPLWATWWFRLMAGVFTLFAGYQLLRFKKNQDLHKIEERKREEMHQLKLQFFTNISHEFRTPLSLILGPLENLLKDSNAISRHYYKMMYRNANRLLHLINELMDFRKVETGALTLKVAPGNLNSFVQELAEEFEDLAMQKHIDLQVIEEDQGFNAWFDRQVVEKILLNLINNSLKYTPANGCVKIELLHSLQNFQSAFGNELVLKNNFRASQYAYIRISDNGIGISKDSIEHLFERYYRITESHLGSGIGLAFVKSLTVMHKGDIYVYSERHQGTDIIIALPVNKKDYEPDERWIESINEGGIRLESMQIASIELSPEIAGLPQLMSVCKDSKKRHILIVDDNDEIRAFIRNCLEEIYYITEAIDGNTGMSKAKEELPDLIISDVMMPGLNGIDFCKLIKEDLETSHIPFIMLTAKANLDAEIEGVGSGADLYLSKPLSINLLLLSIRNIFEQRQKLKDRYLKNHYVDAHELVHSSKDKEFMDKLLCIINAELSNPDLDIDDICNSVGMSRTKLYHKIKELSGQAPNEFIRSIRLKKAIEILTHEDVLLTEVMYRVGIQTQSYFTKAFKKEFGKTPTQYLQDLLVKP
jgi:ligand-binding sensor domain-containing protein/signal transduction histidine kinase/CheY-like chemotaxis protein/AraC-like DNA-binding protein